MTWFGTVEGVLWDLLLAPSGKARILNFDANLLFCVGIFGVDYRQLLAEMESCTR